MSSPAGSGRMVAHYRLMEPLGRSLWKAEDTKRGRLIALKVLSRTVPSDATRRDALLQKVRQRASVHHLGLPAVLEIDVVANSLVMELELVEGRTLARALGGKPLDDTAILRLAWQMADVLGALHGKTIVHGQLTSEDVLLTPDDDVVVTGLSLPALTERPERNESALLGSAEPADLARLAFRAPEQITSRGLDPRSDIFALGAILYHASTGRVPFSGATAPDVANAVLKSVPSFPMEHNPRLKPAIAAVITKCMMKDPAQRYPSMRALQEDLRRINPAIHAAASRKTVTPPQGTHPGRTETTRGTQTVIVAAIPYFDLIDRTDHERAARLSARMQQVFGEAVLLADGTIVDSLGTRFVATVPDSARAVEALRQAQREIAELNANGEGFEPVVAAHAGEVALSVGSAHGPAVELAERLLKRLEPLQIAISAPALGDEADGAPALGEFEGIEFFTLPEPKATPLPEPSAAAGNVEAASAEAPAPGPAPRKLPIVWIGAAAAAVVVLAVAAAMLLRHEEAAPAVVAATPAKTATAAATDVVIDLAPFAVDGTDPAVVRQGVVVERAVRAMLAALPDATLTPDPAAPRFAVRSATGGAPDQVVAWDGSTEGPATSLSSPAEAASTIAQWIATRAGSSRPGVASSNPEAMGSWIEAIQASLTPDAAAQARAVAAIRKAQEADPAFLPASRMAVDLLAAAGDAEGSTAAAEAVLRAVPGDDQLRSALVTQYRERGRQAAAIPHAARLAAADPSMLVFLGRQALGAGDEAAFRTVLQRLKGHPSPLHQPDLVATQGRLPTAVQQYYALEEANPNDAALALKIGRIAILRHSTAVADEQLAKLLRLDPDYGAPLLSAYIAADARDAAAATRHLGQAIAAAGPDDDVQTSAAEIHALLSDHPAVMASLRKALARGEPTMAYVLANPLYAYLQDDAAFQEIRAALGQRRIEIADALRSAGL